MVGGNEFERPARTFSGILCCENKPATDDSTGKFLLIAFFFCSLTVHADLAAFSGG